MRKNLLPLLCLLFAIVYVPGVSRLHAQRGSQGTIQLTVVDPSGAVINGADLELVNNGTNDTRKAETDSKGTYSFVNLPIGTYRLTCTKSGFAPKIYESVEVQAAVVNGLNVTLTVGAVADTVRVTATEIPVLVTSSNAVGTIVDMKQIEELPLQGRDITALSRLVPGWTGTFNGLPSPDSGNNIDGVIGVANRAKYNNGGATQASVSPRVETIEQMSVQTSQLDLGSGYGLTTNQLNYVTRRGTNNWHFRAYYDFRNSGLNANSWTNNAAGLRRPKLILHDFGVSAGGPILHDKLFIFGSFASSRQPQGALVQNSVFTPSAQQGNFTYTGSDGKVRTVNVFQLAGKANPSLPTTVNAVTANQLALINKSISYGTLTSVADPTLNTINFITSAPNVMYFPAVRVDYNLSQKLRADFAFMTTTTTRTAGTYPAPFPGPDFSNQDSGFYNRSYIASFGLDYTFSPKTVNQTKLGFLYSHNEFAYNAAQLYKDNPVVFWGTGAGFPGDASNSNKMSGMNYTLPTGNYYPVFSAANTTSWQHGGHTMNFGASWYREQDHYYNPPVGFPNITLGLATGDPALQAFTGGASGSMPLASSANLSEAQQLYAVLTGRISTLSGSFPFDVKTGTYKHVVDRYNLNELSNAWALFFQDSWKVMPTLTLNYGLRWDFVGDQHDLTGAYHSLLPDSLFGPTAAGDLFKPGALNGNPNPVISQLAHTYSPFRVTPQPAFGFAWNPHITEDGFLKKLLAGDGTVIRGGYALRRFTEPYQFFWNAASNYGTVFYQFFGASANTTGKPGTFTPGSASLGNPLPGFVYTPTTVSPSMPLTQFTYVANSPGVSGMNPDIRQPYVQSWNFGVQRQMGNSRVLEVRYVGNRTLRQWIQLNTNEVNIFENGFLNEFKRAQANLAAHGNKSFSDVGTGNPTPILDAAFGGASSTTFTSAQFINYLLNGQAGTFASQLAGNNNNTPLYFCNLVGTKFAPCATNAGYTTAGAGYPINFFQANPYGGGRAGNYMTDSAYSNYHSMQVEYRQAVWKGLQLNANYTWSHALGVASNNQFTAGSNSVYTLRDLRLGYGPSLFDITHVAHISGTYDLPFGTGRAFFSDRGIWSNLLGGFNVGTILTYQTGLPFILLGGNSTFNNYADGGVNLVGITPADLQHSVGVYRIPGQTTVNTINPKYLTTTGAANPTYLQPNTAPGTFGSLTYLHGPHGFYNDIAVTKSFLVREKYNFRLQSEFINVFNHPVFGNTAFGSSGAAISTTTSNVQNTTFSRVGLTNANGGFGRVIELRANFEF